MVLPVTDFDLLARFAAVLEDTYPIQPDDWPLSPFDWIRRTPSARLGTIGEKLVACWAEGCGFDVERSQSKQCDRLINGNRVEIKTSTLWEAGIYKFSQVRDQDYDYCFCLGLSPLAVHTWLLPKDVLLEHVIGHTGQHTGVAAMETAWISVLPDFPHAWMRPYAGLAAAEQLLETEQEMAA